MVKKPVRQKPERSVVRSADVKYSRAPDQDNSNTNTETSETTTTMPPYRKPFLQMITATMRKSHKTSGVVCIAVALSIFCFWYLWIRLSLDKPPQTIVWSDDTMHEQILHNPEEILAERIVHFDLKGAAPRAAYFKQLFPLLKLAGATGVLLEWEDVFPFHGELSMLRHGDAYDDKDFRSILDAAREAGLRIVPLIQTFGHMEWALKHKKFTDLREVPRYPQVICPTLNQSLTLVKSIIDDIVKSHDGYIDTIHIGADEAYHVGTECKRCAKRIEELGGLDRLMLEYVTKVAKYVKEKHQLRVMMWNDMYDKTDPAVLRSYRMHELVEPVIWGYANDLLKRDYFPDGVFDRFPQVFNRLWLGSAFKGANWPDQPYVDLRRYARNHLSWLQVLAYYGQPLQKKVVGIILTGWQRFDHFAILCELLPAAMPSLVFNLQVVQYGGVKPTLFNNTRKILRCKTQSNWTTDVPEWEALIERFFNQSHIKLRPAPAAPVLDSIRCEFPGSEVYALIERLRYVKHEYDLFMNCGIRRGWMHEYNMHHQYGSVHHAEITYNVTEALIYRFSRLGSELQVELSKLFYDDTVTEWLFNNVQIHLNKLRELSLAAVQIKQTVEFRNRPLTHMKLDL